MEKSQNEQIQSDRRSFLTNCGKAAVVAPPVVTALLSTSLSSPAIAASTGGTVTKQGLAKGGPGKGQGKGAFNNKFGGSAPVKTPKGGDRHGMGKGGQ